MQTSLLSTDAPSVIADAVPAHSFSTKEGRSDKSTITADADKSQTHFFFNFSYETHNKALKIAKDVDQVVIRFDQKLICNKSRAQGALCMIKLRHMYI